MVADATAAPLLLLSSFARPLSSGVLRQCFVVDIDGDDVKEAMEDGVDNDNDGDVGFGRELVGAGDPHGKGKAFGTMAYVMGGVLAPGCSAALLLLLLLLLSSTLLVRPVSFGVLRLDVVIGSRW